MSCVYDVIARLKGVRGSCRKHVAYIYEDEGVKRKDVEDSGLHEKSRRIG